MLRLGPFTRRWLNLQQCAWLHDKCSHGQLTTCSMWKRAQSSRNRRAFASSSLIVSQIWIGRACREKCLSARKAKPSLNLPFSASTSLSVADVMKHWLCNLPLHLLCWEGCPWCCCMPPQPIKYVCVDHAAPLPKGWTARNASSQAEQPKCLVCYPHKLRRSLS